VWNLTVIVTHKRVPVVECLARALVYMIVCDALVFRCASAGFVVTWCEFMNFSGTGFIFVVLQCGGCGLRVHAKCRRDVTRVLYDAIKPAEFTVCVFVCARWEIHWYELSLFSKILREFWCHHNIIIRSNIIRKFWFEIPLHFLRRELMINIHVLCWIHELFIYMQKCRV